MHAVVGTWTMDLSVMVLQDEALPGVMEGV